MFLHSREGNDPSHNLLRQPEGLKTTNAVAKQFHARTVNGRRPVFGTSVSSPLSFLHKQKVPIETFSNWPIPFAEWTNLLTRADLGSTPSAHPPNQLTQQVAEEQSFFYV